MSSIGEQRFYRTAATRTLGARSRGEGKGLERDESVRYCECGTKLSAYNPNDTCWAHTERKPLRLRASYKSIRP